MFSFTLDTNCIIAIDEGRAEAAAIRSLVDAHSAGTAQVALVAISASERQKDGGILETFSQFRERLSALNLGHLELLKPIFYLDVTFFDWALWATDDMEVIEKKSTKFSFLKLNSFGLIIVLLEVSHPMRRPWRTDGETPSVMFKHCGAISITDAKCSSRQIRNFVLTRKSLLFFLLELIALKRQNLRWLCSMQPKSLFERSDSWISNLMGCK